MDSESIQEYKLLYDDVAQLLYSIMLGFASLDSQKLDPKVQHHFTELKESTCELFGKIQRTATRSEYVVLSSFGFLPAIRKWVKHCEDEFNIRSVIRMKGIDEDERWTEDQELALYLLCKDWIFQTFRYMARRNGDISLMIVKQDKELQLIFHAPDKSSDEEWWYTQLMQNPYYLKDIGKYYRSFQLQLSKSDVTILVSLI